MSEIILKGIPTLRILDYGQAVDFYIQGLGFNVDWEHRFSPNEPVYLQISRNGLTLHLSENMRFEADTIIFVDCKELTKLHSELKNRNSHMKLPKPEKTCWQTI